MERPLRILVLYNEKQLLINPEFDLIKSFAQYSKHEIWYLTIYREMPEALDLTAFDVVILSYSVLLNQTNSAMTGELSTLFSQALQAYQGYKIAFIQNEHENTNNLRANILKLGIDTVYTHVPEAYISQVFPPKQFPQTRFMALTTGFVPLSQPLFDQLIKPLHERRWVIGYRSIIPPFWHGQLAREKVLIGERMQRECSKRGIAANINWKLSYGNSWYRYLAKCKATLATEVGVNVFDVDGSIRQHVTSLIQQTSDLSYDTLYENFLHQHDNKIQMNQISPKVYEAASLKTALILFEGEHSGVVEPNKHYIPLKKDFSNLNDVFNKLADNNYLQQITEQAYEDIIQTDKYHYKHFIARLDAKLSEVVATRSSVAATQSTMRYLNVNMFKNKSNFIPLLSLPTDKPLRIEQLSAYQSWGLEPAFINAQYNQLETLTLSFLGKQIQVALPRRIFLALRALRRKIVGL